MKKNAPGNSSSPRLHSDDITLLPKRYEQELYKSTIRRDGQLARIVCVNGIIIGDRRQHSCTKMVLLTVSIVSALRIVQHCMYVSIFARLKKTN